MRTVLFIIIILICNQFISAQNIFKPIGCSVSSGPNLSTPALQNTNCRYQLILRHWKDIETSPGVFNFSALQTMINTVKSYNKKYSLVIAAGGPGSPLWLTGTLNAPYITYLFHGISYKLPLWWNNTVQQRLSMLATALGNQFSSDTSLALVYISQMTTNGVEGHLNGINMATMYSAGFTQTNWINAAKQTAYYFINAFPTKAIAFEVHDVDNTTLIPQTIITDLYNDSSTCRRIGAAMFWLSGRTSYQPNLVNFLLGFQGDKYAQMITSTRAPGQFQDSSIVTAFNQAQQLNIRYIEFWHEEYQYNTIDTLLSDFNNWSDSVFTLYDSCSNVTGIGEHSSLISDFYLRQNYPNPFNPSTLIDFVLPNYGEVKLTIIDLLGQEVAVLVNGKRSAGRHSVLFEAGNLPSGIYFYQLETSDFTETRKMLLLK